MSKRVRTIRRRIDFADKVDHEYHGDAATWENVVRPLVESRGAYSSFVAWASMLADRLAGVGGFTFITYRSRA